MIIPYKKIMQLILCLFVAGTFLSCGGGNGSAWEGEKDQSQGELQDETEGGGTIGLPPRPMNPIWTEIPNTKLEDSVFDWSSQGGAPGVIGTAGVMAFSGAAFDTTRNRLLLHGGGHADYGGQEIYAFDIDTSTWSLVAPPENKADLEETDCTLEGQENYGYRTANNLPKSVHTYDRLVYVEQLDAMLDGRASVGFVECRGTKTEIALYKFGEAQWEWWATPSSHVDDLPYPTTYVIGGAGAAAAVHPDTKEVYFVSSEGGRITRWNPTTDTWTQGRFDNIIGQSLHKNAVIDSTRNNLIISTKASESLSLFIVPLEDFTENVTRAQDHSVSSLMTGDNAFLSVDGGKYITFDYDPVGDQLVAWAGGADIYTMNLDTLEWTQHTVPGAVSGVIPGSASAAGTYGRFRYVASIDKFLLVRSTSENVFLLDLRAEQPVTTFELTSETAGNVPFTTAVGFKRGDVLTSPTLDLNNYQVDVKRRWPDNSVKHAIFSGTYNSVADTPTVVTVLSGGDAPVGTSLTEADIVATAVVDLGSYGTASLAPLLGTPEKIWLQGPEMIEAHYHTTASLDTELSVWFHVRFYKGGAVRVRTTVEYGYADVKEPEPKAYRPVATVGGATVFNYPLIQITNINEEIDENGDYRQIFSTSAQHPLEVYDSIMITGVTGMTEINNKALRVSSSNLSTNTFASWTSDIESSTPLSSYTGGGEVLLAHMPHQRWSVVGWDGISDPSTTVRHDTEYMQASKLVLNYWKGPPGESALNELTQEYYPMRVGDLRTSMGAPGFSQQIGLLPGWDALYVTSGGDPRAYRAVEANSSSLNSHAIVWSDPSTYTPVIPSQWPGGTVNPGTGLGDRTIRTGGYAWEYNHHGSSGYMAYLITGDYFHYDTMRHQAGLLYLAVPTGDGLGTNRVLRMEVRGTAWALRSIGQLVGIGPVSDPFLQELGDLIETSVAYHGAYIGMEGTTPTGFLFSRSVGGWTTTTGSTSTFMQFFLVATMGHISDLGLSDVINTAPLIEFRDHLYRIPVGLLGPGGAGNHCFTHAAYSGYTVIALGENIDIEDPRTFLQTWGEIFEARYGMPNPEVCGTVLQEQSGSFAVYYAATVPWGNLLPAISYAVEHGAPGAADAFARLQSADNWSTYEDSGFDDIPIWGIYPRGWK